MTCNHPSNDCFIWKVTTLLSDTVTYQQMKADVVLQCKLCGERITLKSNIGDNP